MADSATINEIISIEVDLPKLRADFEQAKKVVEGFVDSLNLKQIGPQIQSFFAQLQPSIAQLNTVAGQVQSSFQGVAQSVNNAVSGINQATNATKQLGTETRNVSTHSKAVEKGFREMAKDFPGLVSSAVRWSIAWSAAQGAITLALAPFTLFAQSLRESFGFLTELQQKTRDIQDLLVQNVTLSGDQAENLRLAAVAAEKLAIFQEEAAASIGATPAAFRNVMEGAVSTGILKAVREVNDSTEDTLKKATRAVALIISAEASVGVGLNDLRRIISDVTALLEGTITARSRLRIASGLSASELNKQSLEFQKQGKFLTFIEERFKAQADRIATNTQRMTELNTQLNFFRVRLQSEFFRPFFDKLISAQQQVLKFFQANEQQLKSFARESSTAFNTAVDVALSLSKALFEVARSITTMLGTVGQLTARVVSLGAASEKLSGFRFVVIGIARSFTALATILDRIRTDFAILADEAERLKSTEGLLSLVSTPRENDTFKKELAEREALEEQHTNQLEELRQRQVFFNKKAKDAEQQQNIDAANEFIRLARETFQERQELEKRFQQGQEAFLKRQAEAERLESRLVVERLRKEDERRAEERNKALVNLLPSSTALFSEELPSFIPKDKEPPETKLDNSKAVEQLRQFREAVTETKARFAELQDGIKLSIADGEESVSSGSKKIIELFQEQGQALEALADKFTKETERLKGQVSPQRIEATLDAIRLSRIREAENTRKAIADIERKLVEEEKSLAFDRFKFIRELNQEERKQRVDAIKFDAQLGLKLRSDALSAELDLENQALQDQLAIFDKEQAAAKKTARKLQEIDQARARAVLQSQGRASDIAQQFLLALEEEEKARREQSIVSLRLETEAIENKARVIELGNTTELERLRNNLEIQKSNLALIQSEKGVAVAELVRLTRIGATTEKLQEQLNVIKQIRNAEALQEAVTGKAEFELRPSLGKGFARALFGSDTAGKPFESFGAALKALSAGGLETANALRNLQSSIGGIINAFRQSFGTGLQAVGSLFPAIGSTVGKLSKGVGGAVSKVLEQASPIIQLAGAAIDVFKAIFGRAARKIADSIREDFGRIMKAFESGTVGLGNTLAALEAERLSAIHKLSGRKNGQSELNKLLAELEPAIAQLRKQQQETQQSFQEELRLLRLSSDTLADFATRWDEINKKVTTYLESFANADLDIASQTAKLGELQTELDAINKQISEFGSAGFLALDSALEGLLKQQGNIQEQIAKIHESIVKSNSAIKSQQDAADFLNLQLKKLQADAQEELNSLESDAIANALRLRDLLQDRLDLQDELNRKTFEILSSGSIEKRQSFAVKKGQELADLKKEFQTRLDGINDELKLVNVRFQKEKDIFNLSQSTSALRNRASETEILNFDKIIGKALDLKSILSSISFNPANLAPFNPAFAGGGQSIVFNGGINLTISGVDKVDAPQVVDSIEREIRRRSRSGFGLA